MEVEHVNSRFLHCRVPYPFRGHMLSGASYGWAILQGTPIGLRVIFIREPPRRGGPGLPLCISLPSEHTLLSLLRVELSLMLFLLCGFLGKQAV